MSTRYVYPPRPKGKMHPRDLEREERRRVWLAQYKFKGSRTLVHLEANGQVQFYNRHGEIHKRFKPSQELVQEFRSLNLQPNVDYVLDGELLDHFTKHIKGTIVLFDVLWAGRYLLGCEQQKRLQILREICGSPSILEPEGRAFEVSPHIWMAETFDRDFANRFSWAAARPELEGLVLRKRDAKLDNMGHAEYETAHQLRCRRPEKVHGTF